MSKPILWCVLVYILSIEICQIALPHISWKVLPSRDLGAVFARNCLPVINVCCYGNQQAAKTDEINKESLNHLENNIIEILKVLYILHFVYCSYL